MCGIVGSFERGGRPVDAALLDRLVASLERRGPDGAGGFVDGSLGLGVRRLAILDPPRGAQPFSTPDGAVVAVLNGEIYNFRALRRELEARGARFRTDCDAEVVPHAYRRFGAEELARRLDGMFAIAIYDRPARRLHLLRDRFGEKPLFYLDAPARFAFASQLTTLLLLPDADRGVDPVALRHYLALHYVPGARTIFEGLRRVPPGHRLELALDGAHPPRVSRWCEPHAPRPRLRGGHVEAVERVRGALERAAASRRVADVPVGVFLSGGVDSSGLAAALARTGATPRTFSIGFDDPALDESESARRAAAHLGAEHHHYRFDSHACLDVFDEALEGLDEPLGDPACLPLFLLAREARAVVKVVLSGEGADELFGGYGYYPTPARAPAALPAALRRGAAALRRAPPFLRADHTSASGFPLLTTSAERDTFTCVEASDEDEGLRAWSRALAGEPCPLRRAQRADLLSWLPDDLLPKLDHVTMAVSLEGRAPYLAPELAGLALALPAESKRTADGDKRALRDAVAPWLPDGIARRPKQGFVLPLQRWLAGPLRERLLASLDGDLADGLRAAPLRALARAELDGGAARSRLLYALLAYREWFRAVCERRTLAHRLSRGGDAAARVVRVRPDASPKRASTPVAGGVPG